MVAMHFSAGATTVPCLGILVLFQSSFFRSASVPVRELQTAGNPGKDQVKSIVYTFTVKGRVLFD